jgi:hypothetical protein
MKNGIRVLSNFRHVFVSTLRLVDVIRFSSEQIVWFEVPQVCGLWSILSWVCVCPSFHLMYSRLGVEPLYV